MPQETTHSPAWRIARLAPPQGKVRAVIDSDTFNEIDDQFAIVQALLSPDRLAVEAIYAAPFHNSHSSGPGDGMAQSYDEILRLLERLNLSPDGLVHRGATEFIGAARKPIRSAATLDLIARARSSSTEEPLYVIAIAAITNIASALMLAPDIAEKIVVVWLGGHALWWPDTREFNLKQDIPAAQHLFDCGVPLVLIPCMGVISHLHSSVPEIDAHVAPHGQIGAFLAERFRGYSREHLGFSKEIWDMAAVAWLIDEDWLPSDLIPAPILTSEGTWSFDASRPLIRCVRHVKRDPILRDFFQKLQSFAETGQASPSYPQNPEASVPPRPAINAGRAAPFGGKYSRPKT